LLPSAPQAKGPPAQTDRVGPGSACAARRSRGRWHRIPSVNVGGRVGMYVGADVDRDVGGLVSPVLDGVGVVGDAVGAAQTRSNTERGCVGLARTCRQLREYQKGNGALQGTVEYCRVL